MSRYHRLLCFKDLDSSFLTFERLESLPSPAPSSTKGNASLFPPSRLRARRKTPHRRQTPTLLEPSGSSHSWNVSPLLAPSWAAAPLCPENGRYHSTSIRYSYQRTFLWSNILFSTVFSPLSLLYTLHSDQGKRLFRPSKPYSANTSICLFCEKKSVAKAKVFFPMIQSEILSRPHHPPLSFAIFLKQHNCRRAIRHSLFFRRIRGFRFSMAAGSQSVESWAKKLDPVQLGKKIHFSLDIARCSTRARLPAAGDSFAYVLTPFTRETVSKKHCRIDLRI